MAGGVNSYLSGYLGSYRPLIFRDKVVMRWGCLFISFDPGGNLILIPKLFIDDINGGGEVFISF